MFPSEEPGSAGITPPAKSVSTHYSDYHDNPDGEDEENGANNADDDEKDDLSCFCHRDNYHCRHLVLITNMTTTKTTATHDDKKEDESCVDEGKTKDDLRYLCH